jgi:hypothetical protein
MYLHLVTAVAKIIMMLSYRWVSRINMTYLVDHCDISSHSCLQDHDELVTAVSRIMMYLVTAVSRIIMIYLVTAVSILIVIFL